MTVIYSDNTTTIASNTVNSGVWYLVNMTSSLSVGKNISSIQFKWFSAGYISAVGVDDVSLIGTPTVTSTFNVSPSVINNAQVSYNGTTQTIPFNISTSSGNIYVLNATQSLSYSGLQYIFSSWLINGTNSYTNMTLTFQINGNTTFQVNYLFICTLTLTSNYDPAPFTIDSIANVTPFMMNLVSGTHVIIFNATFYYAGPFGAEAVYFDYWNDTNSTSPTRTIDLESDSNYTVLYSLTPPNSTSPPTLNLPSGMPLLWQYIANFDLLGFIVACYVSLIGEAFYAFVIFISFSLVYLKTKSVVLCSILWLLLGGVFMQMTKIISPIAVILVALGITGMIYRLFTHNE
jgi:hypothetical protein